jgi:hypothetical protein
MLDRLKFLTMGPCDIMITSFDTNESLYYNTVHLKSAEELNTLLQDFIKKLASY